MHTSGRLGALVLGLLGVSLIGCASKGRTTGGTGGAAGLGGSGGSGGGGGAGGTGGIIGSGGSGGVGGGTGGTGGTGDTGGTGGTGGVAGTGGSGGGSGARLGSGCTSDADCGGLRCITNIGGSTVPGGLCTTSCGATTDPDAECRPLSATALCVGIGPLGAEEGYCMQACSVGVTTSCHGRSDAACFGLVDTAGNPVGNACIPLCTSDAECPSGTVCNGESNLCTTAPDPGSLPLGSRCNISAAVDECADGMCFEIDASNAFCSKVCRLGTVPQCGWDGVNDMPGLCALVSDDNANLADIGFCAQACNCDSDCTARYPGFVCIPQAGLSQFGKQGICFQGATGIPTCP